MGYQMEYDLNRIVYTTKKPEKKIYVFLSMTALLILLAVAAHFGSTVLEVIIKGQGGAVIAAADQMVANIQEGDPLKEAVQTFCLELIQ